MTSTSYIQLHGERFYGNFQYDNVVFHRVHTVCGSLKGAGSCAQVIIKIISLIYSMDYVDYKVLC